MLYLHSDKSTNDTYTLDRAINGKYKLLSFVCTNNLFNVNDNNNKIYFNENGTDRIATLTNGNYDINDLKTECITALNDVASGTFNITIDSLTRKYTFTSTNNFGFTFGTNTSNSGRKLIGMNASDDTQSLTHTSDTSIDLNTHKNILIDISENDDKNVIGVDYFDTSLVINGLGVFGDMIRYIDNDNFHQYIKVKNTKKLKLRFHDSNNETIDLNSEYIIIFDKI